MQSNTPLNLNLRHPNYATTMYAVQHDRMSRKITAIMTDGDTPFEPQYGTDAIVRYKKPDGTCGFYDTLEDETTPAVSWSGNVATIWLAEQALTVAGVVLCQVNFYDGDKQRLSSFTWKIVVEENVCPDDDITSSDYFNILTQQIASILAVIENMPAPATILPLPDGTAAIGERGEFARSDHVHPAVKKCLYYTSVAISATTGTIATVSNADITADYVLAEISFANPFTITTDVSWTTASGSLTLGGTCLSATTANIVLVKKDN